MKQYCNKWSSVLVAGAAVWILGAASVQAAIIEWQGAVNSDWGTPGNWSGSTLPGVGDTALFDTAAGTINLGSNQTVLGLSFDYAAGPFTFTASPGASLLMAAGGSITFKTKSTAAGVTETFDGPILLQGNAGSITTTTSSATIVGDLLIGNSTSGTSGFTFAGNISSGAASGTSVLALSGATGVNTISGNISDGISGGKVALGIGGGTWVLSGDNSGMTGGVTIGRNTAPVSINSNTALGTGTLTLAGLSTIDNTSGAAVNVSGVSGIGIFGSFAFNASNDLNLGTGAVSLNANTTITFAGDHALTFGGNISQGATGTLGMTKAGIGTLILAGNLSYNGPTSLGYANGTGSNTVAGTIIVSGNNQNYAGGFNVLYGTLGIGGATALGTGTLSLIQAPNSFNTDGSGHSIADDKAIDNTSGAPLTLTTVTPETWANTFNFIGSNDLNTGTGAVTMTGATTVNVHAHTLAIGGNISGTQNLTKTGAGTLSLNGSSVLGGVVVSAGTLILANTTAYNAITVNAGASLLAAANALPSSKGITLAGGKLGFIGDISGSVGALTLTANSFLDFAGSDVFHFGGSSGKWGTNFTLSILDWDPGLDALFFGTNATGLNATQLSNISFYNDSGVLIGLGATLGSDGSVSMIAAPEPSTWVLLGCGVFGLIAVARRRCLCIG